MELVKDIYFNTDKLVENTKVKVSYTGKFYQGNNDKVFIHYGYGKNWDNVNEAEMVKTDLGYQTELDLVGGDTINFCFKNQNNEWDNNLGCNYIFNIEKANNPVIGETSVGNNEVNNVFWGKSFNSNESADNIPTSVDAILHGNGSIDTGFEIKPSLSPNADVPVVNGCVSTAGTSDIFPKAEVTNNPVNSFNNGNKCANNNNQINAIALAPTGFNYWTKKIKNTVCKFFSYVPKFISGNYKRDLSDSKK